MLIEQANSLLEDTENMSKFLCKEKVQLENDEAKSRKAIIKSSCQKAIRNNLPSVDINNNQTDSESS